MKKFLFICAISSISILIKGQPVDSVSKIQLCLILDVSGSMQGLLSQAQNEIWKTLTFIEKHQKDSLETVIEISVLSHGNAEYAASGHVKTIIDFTTDVDQVAEELFEIKVGGGNEYCGAAIKHGLDSLHWSTENIFRCMVIAGNESFVQGDVPFGDAITECRQKGILVNTIYCGSPNQAIHHEWDTAAHLGGGQFAMINQDIDIDEFKTPYDYNLLEFYFDYKSTYLMEEKEKRTWRQKYVSRSGEVSPAYRDMVMYKFLQRKKDPDLVDKFNESNWELDEFDLTEIPDRWKGLEKNRLKFKLLEMSRKRNMYEKGFRLYAEKVEEFLTITIAPQLQEKTLDLAMREMLSQQLASFGYALKDK